jgi:septum formation protein
MRKIILASASPRRKELLEKAGVTFTVQAGNGEEVITSTDPQQVVMELSLQKAQQIAGEEEEGTLIIGADTVVVYEGKILGKPSDDADAEATLKFLQGNTHQVYTGVTVLRRENGSWEPLTFAEKTDVTVYPMTDQEIRDYVKTGEARDKAGSYGIQGRFHVYVKGICGDYNNVVGLPVARLIHELKNIGIDLRG